MFLLRVRRLRLLAFHFSPERVQLVPPERRSSTTKGCHNFPGIRRSLPEITPDFTFLLSFNHVDRPLPSTYCRPKNQISRSPIVLTTCSVEETSASISEIVVSFPERRHALVCTRHLDLVEERQGRTRRWGTSLFLPGRRAACQWSPAGWQTPARRPWWWREHWSATANIRTHINFRTFASTRLQPSSLAPCEEETYRLRHVGGCFWPDSKSDRAAEAREQWQDSRKTAIYRDTVNARQPTRLAKFEHGSNDHVPVKWPCAVSARGPEKRWLSPAMERSQRACSAEKNGDRGEQSASLLQQRLRKVLFGRGESRWCVDASAIMARRGLDHLMSVCCRSLLLPPWRPGVSWCIEGWYSLQLSIFFHNVFLSKALASFLMKRSRLQYIQACDFRCFFFFFVLILNTISHFV